MTSANAYIGIDTDETFTAAQVTAGDHPHKLGTVVQTENANGVLCTYKFVKYDNGSGDVAAVANYAAYYVAQTGYLAHTVTSDFTDAETGSSSEVGAGVLQAVIPDGGAGWVQIRGPATLGIALDGGSDGQALTATGVTTDGSLTTHSLAATLACAVATDASEKEIICMFPE